MPVVNLLTTLFFLFVRVHLPSLAFFLLSNRIYTCTSVHVILTTWFCRYHWNPAKTYILKFFEGLTLLNNYYQRTYHIDYWIAALYVRKKRKSLRLLFLYIVAPKFCDWLPWLVCERSQDLSLGFDYGLPTLSTLFWNCSNLRITYTHTVLVVVKFSEQGIKFLASYHLPGCMLIHREFFPIIRVQLLALNQLC